MVHSPLLALSLVVATLYAALFHLLRGRTMRDLLLYWAASLAGFAAGHLIAAALSWPDPLVGELHIAPASIACVSLMSFAQRLKS
jgi:CHASE2 domain-containing sensor protein